MTNFKQVTENTVCWAKFMVGNKIKFILFLDTPDSMGHEWAIQVRSGRQFRFDDFTAAHDVAAMNLQVDAKREHKDKVKIVYSDGTTEYYGIHENIPIKYLFYVYGETKKQLKKKLTVLRAEKKAV